MERSVVAAMAKRPDERRAATLPEIGGMAGFTTSMQPGPFVRARPHLFRMVPGAHGVIMLA